MATTLSACGTEQFPDRTAVVAIDGDRTTYELGPRNCGVDGDTVFLLGHDTGGGVLQAVIGLDPDDPTTALADHSGATVSDGPVDRAAFGPEAWTRRDGRGDPPGRVTNVSIRGARIRLEGEAVTLAPDGGRPDPERRPIELDARCSALDD